MHTLRIVLAMYLFLYKTTMSLTSPQPQPLDIDYSTDSSTDINIGGSVYGLVMQPLYNPLQPPPASWHPRGVPSTEITMTANIALEDVATKSPNATVDYYSIGPIYTPGRNTSSNVRIVGRPWLGNATLHYSELRTGLQFIKSNARERALIRLGSEMAYKLGYINPMKPTTRTWIALLLVEMDLIIFNGSAVV